MENDYNYDEEPSVETCFGYDKFIADYQEEFAEKGVLVSPEKRPNEVEGPTIRNFCIMSVLEYPFKNKNEKDNFIKKIDEIADRQEDDTIVSFQISDEQKRERVLHKK